MHIQFETSSIGQTEARGLIGLLSALLGESVPPSVNSVNNLTPQAATPEVAPALSPAEPSHLAVVGAGMKEDPATPTTEQTTKRTRRTKAEMEAEKAATPSDPTQPSTATPVEASGTTQPVVASKGTVTADELRALLNGYIAKYSMEAAIDQLKTFGCNRVTEALALEPEKLSALAAALNG